MKDQIRVFLSSPSHLAHEQPQRLPYPNAQSKYLKGLFLQKAGWDLQSDERRIVGSNRILVGAEDREKKYSERKENPYKQSNTNIAFA